MKKHHQLIFNNQLSIPRKKNVLGCFIFEDPYSLEPVDGMLKNDGYIKFPDERF